METNQSDPSSYLLKCFNALSPKMAAAPAEIPNHLEDYRHIPLTADDIAISDVTSFDCVYTSEESTQSSFTKSALSFGLSGSYGPYSGSVQASAESEEQSDADVINGSIAATLDLGTTAFKQSNNPAAVAKHLDPDLLAQLNAIDSFAAAEDFTRVYGTHVVVSVNRGGTLTLVVQVESKSLAEKNQLSLDVKAAYTGLGSMEATADASKTVQTFSSTKSLSHTLKALGGDPDLAASVDIDSPQSIGTWAKSCQDNNSVSGLADTMELYELATSKTAGTILKNYLDLCLLKHSLENPVVFSKMTPLSAGTYNFAGTKADTDYKIISGGAWLDVREGSDYLTGSFPAFDGSEITTWQAVSHDCAIPTPAGAQLISYAIGVHDPANLLQVYCTSVDGQNPKTGADMACAQLPGGYVLTGGGCETSSTQQYARYLTGSYPVTVNNQSDSWVADGHDYNNASAATLKAWVVGIQLAAGTPATLTHDIIAQPGGLQSHGSSFAIASGSGVAGGGIQLSTNAINLVHASFPTIQSGNVGWQEYNGDLDGHVDEVEATAYVISLQLASTDADVTLKPYDAQVQAQAAS